MTKQIPLTQGKVALVDDDTFVYLMKWTWCANKIKKTFYAARKTERKGRQETFYMHRVILGIHGDASKLVDHIDMNGLNNQKSNLRIATKSTNGINRGLDKDNTTGYKGVTTQSGKRRKKYVAQIGHKGKHIYLGHYFTPEEAARAYDEAARKLFGEFAYTNF